MHALFDTGAEMTAISRSTLERFGAKPLPGGTHDSSSTGAVNAVQLAMIPELHLGSTVMRKVPVMIEEDSALVVGSGKEKRPVDIIVGYSVMRRLGSLGVESPGRISLNTAGNTAGNEAGNEVGNKPGNDAGARFSREAQLIEVGPTIVLSPMVQGRPCKFLLDTGANTTTLTKSFYDANGSLFAPGGLSSQPISGVGGSTVVDRYTLPELAMTFITGNAKLANVAVFPKPSALDVEGLMGNMGRDLWGKGSRFQIDFRRHILSF
jgi:hypothetical protein